MVARQPAGDRGLALPQTRRGRVRSRPGRNRPAPCRAAHQRDWGDGQYPLKDQGRLGGISGIEGGPPEKIIEIDLPGLGRLLPQQPLVASLARPLRRSSVSSWAFYASARDPQVAARPDKTTRKKIFTTTPPPDQLL